MTVAWFALILVFASGCQKTLATKCNTGRTCGNQTYDSSVSTCCDNTIVNSVGYPCCGNQVYNPSFNTFTTPGIPQYMCCGSVVIDVWQMSCCNGRATSSRSWNPFSQCCGTDFFNGYSQTCCNGTVNQGKVSCCGNKGFDPKKQTCCAGVLNDGAGLSCCGTVGFTRPMQCCDPNASSGIVGLGCCGIPPYANYPFDPSSSTCCNGMIISGCGLSCCGAVGFNSTMKCCDSRKSRIGKIGVAC